MTLEGDSDCSPKLLRPAQPGELLLPHTYVETVRKPMVVSSQYAVISDKVGNYNGKGLHYCPVCKFCPKVTTSLQDKVKHLFLDNSFSNNRQVSVLIQHMEIGSFPPSAPKLTKKKEKK